MTTTSITVKGQVLLPVELRRKYGIKPHDFLGVVDRDGEIVILPLPKDPIAHARGILKGGPSLRDDLRSDRKKELGREK
jgi:AbrB family looped-hinge helix DNA binding protein